MGFESYGKYDLMTFLTLFKVETDTQLKFTCSNSTIETIEKRCEICSK